MTSIPLARPAIPFSMHGALLPAGNDGEPIADNNRDKIFLPFFTTRRESGGTGMGLEIVRSMLRAHRGGRSGWRRRTTGLRSC
jgi:nitrogen-specific signal transduction histidine kinase